MSDVTTVSLANKFGCVDEVQWLSLYEDKTGVGNDTLHHPNRATILPPGTKLNICHSMSQFS